LKKVLYSLILISLAINFIPGCEYKPSSFGDFEKIVVFADSTLYNHVRTELEQTFDQFVYTPHSERSFYLDLQPLSMLNTYQSRRNLLFIGLLDGQDQVSKFVNKVLSEDAQRNVLNGNVFEIFREDLFATEQEVMIFAAKDIGTLQKNLSDRKDIIFNRLNTSYFQRLEYAMFLKGEQFVIEEYLIKEYGWKIRVQHDYQIVKEVEDKSFIWFRRLNPDRCLFIYRFPYKNLDEEGIWLYHTRDSLATIYFEGDSIDREDTYIQFIEFAGTEAKKLVGIWQNHRYYVGGPFRTYAFADEKEKFIYLIDISVTAPGHRKKPYLDQLEVLANSFQFVNYDNLPAK
jgi:hypothetical protein